MGMSKLDANCDEDVQFIDKSLIPNPEVARTIVNWARPVQVEVGNESVEF
jgi:hypothetical protein